MQPITQEIRYAIRQLAKSPGFAVVSVLTLALGIGANIALFSVTNAVLLNPSGVPHASGIVALRARYNALPDLASISFSAPDFGDAADGKDTFAAAAVADFSDFNFSRENANPELLNGARVSAGYFDVFAVRPLLGRVFSPEEDQPGAALQVVLSHDTWTKRFASDPNIIGRSLILNQQSYRVIGVMGPEFKWPNQVELWVPLALPPARGSPTSLANLDRAYAASNREAEAMELLNDLKRRSASGYSNASEVAMIYAALGDKDQAMTWLEKGYAERFNPSVLLRPGFDPVRSDSRFQNLVRRIGLSG